MEILPEAALAPGGLTVQAVALLELQLIVAEEFHEIVQLELPLQLIEPLGVGHGVGVG